MLDQILKTYDIQLTSIWLQKEIREIPEFARKYNLDFDEQKHRWVNRDTGEVHDHLENDNMWEEKNNINLKQKKLKELWNKGLKQMLIAGYKKNEYNQYSKEDDYTDRSNPTKFMSDDEKHQYFQLKMEIDNENKKEAITIQIKEKLKKDQLKKKNWDAIKKDKEYLSHSDLDYSVDALDYLSKEVNNLEKNMVAEKSYDSAIEKPVIAEYIDRYDEINTRIRNGMPNELDNKLKSVMHALGKNGVVYRDVGMSFNSLNFSKKLLKKGNKFQLKSFTSTSRNPKYAWDFTISNQADAGLMISSKSQDIPIIAELHYDENTQGIVTNSHDLAQIRTMQPEEWETILDYSQVFEIISVDMVPFGENTYNIPSKTKRPIIKAKISNSFNNIEHRITFSF